MNKEERSPRRQYEKPELRVIRLVEEEIMGKCRDGAAGKGITNFCSSCSSQYGRS
ncbi:MAG TPA: hypothetical protein PLP42_12750 [Acidobacteriota bacterium]|nr:hypothetical protein [Acidobacteriota bacterium]